MLAHNVYFSLTDSSPAAVDRLVRACRTYLSDHPGTLFFAAGVVAEDCQREVNVRDFHVGLHLVFADKDAHDRYQVSEAHQQFIAEGKNNWRQVRVFDSYVEN